MSKMRPLKSLSSITIVIEEVNIIKCNNLNVRINEKIEDLKELDVHKDVNDEKSYFDVLISHDNVERVKLKAIKNEEVSNKEFETHVDNIMNVEKVIYIVK